jgi:outer membrane protein OmpA-like peptidoglycan-associated protein
MRSRRLHRLFFILSLFALPYTGNAQSNFTLSDTSFTIGQKYTLKEIRFSMHHDVHGFPEESISELDSIASFIKKHANVIFEISAHTDTRGKDSLNLVLSDYRAKYVRDYMLEQGVNPDNIIAKGYGELEPLLPEKEINKYKRTDAAKFRQLHQRNRRIELKVININTE